MIRYLLLFTLLCGLHCTLRAQTYAPAPERYGVDEELRLLLVHPGPTLTGGTHPSEALAVNLTTLELGGRSFTLTPVAREIRYDRPYIAEYEGQSYQLHFTRLPLFTLTTETEIRDDPKVDVSVGFADASRAFTRAAGVEYRGGFSQTFPKKTFDLEFAQDVTFGHLRSDDDWILDAIYNEPLRINAYAAHELWLDQHQLYYRGRDDRAKPGAGVLFVEAFVNGRYYGLQMLSEQVDRKLLRLKKPEGRRIRGELYKGSDHLAGTDFSWSPPPAAPGEETWSGWEWKHPDTDGGPDWDNLEDFHRFVLSSSDADFVAGIATRLNLDNIIDNLLFINLTGMIDNSSRNTYLARYDAGEPYIQLPWDFDGSWGNSPRGFFVPNDGSGTPTASRAGS